jgi:hypothetical protein
VCPGHEDDYLRVISVVPQIQSRERSDQVASNSSFMLTTHQRPRDVGLTWYLVETERLRDKQE